MSNALAIYGQFDQLQRAALALQKSGFFPDVKSEAQAIVKVMAGAELGIPPFASMTGIHIIQGKPALGANVIATLVKNDPRYDYRVKVCNAENCVLIWFENGNQVGEAGFTMTEAQAANLNGKENWKKFPSDMLFARAISRGARRYAPGIFGGSPVYTPDELGAETDPDGYIETVVTEVSPPRPAEEILPELGFDIEYPPELAVVANSNGEPYVNLPSEKLKHMRRAMGKKLDEPNALPPDQRAQYEKKCAAIDEILRLRSE